MSNSPTSSRITLRLVIHGRVQGVGFRESMRQQAQSLGIAGWVRNCSNWTVEAVVHGESVDVDTIVQWAHRGSEMAKVNKLKSCQTKVTIQILRLFGGNSSS